MMLGDNLKKEKGMSVTFYYADVVSEKKIVEAIEGNESLVDEDASIVLNGEIYNVIPAGFIEYEVLLSGIDKV